MTVQGAGIPAGATVVSISGTTAVISNPVTQTLTAVGIAFGGELTGGGFGDDNDITAGGGFATDFYVNSGA
jgi:hypothetical protein